MALNPSNSSNLDQLELNGLNMATLDWIDMVDNPLECWRSGLGKGQEFNCMHQHVNKHV